MSTTSIFGNFVSSAHVSKELGIGSWNVRILSVEETDSFHNNDGSKKAAKDMPMWNDPTPQFQIKFMEPLRKEFHTGRLQQAAFRKSNTITKAELKAGLLEVVGEYIIDKATKIRLRDGEFITDDDGNVAIEPADSGLAKCASIISEFLKAAGAEEGTNDINPAIAAGTLLTITIVNKEYQSKDHYRISSYKKYTAPVTGYVDDTAAFEG
jgi:hypothetical protein